MSTPESETHVNTVTPPPQSLTPLHLASTVNIMNHVKVTLDLSNPNYKTWKELMKITVGKFNLQSHLATNSPNNTNPEWIQLDYIVLSWLYTSISPDVFQIVFKPNALSYEIWNLIEQLFLDNKKTRILQLEEDLSKCTLGSRTITEYCQHLKTISDGMTEIDHPISDENLVLQTLRGLPDEYASLVTVISHQNPSPSFLQMRSMLVLEETRQHRNKQTPIAPTALTAQTQQPRENSNLRGRYGNGRGGRFGRGGRYNKRWNNNRGYWQPNNQYFNGFSYQPPHMNPYQPQINNQYSSPNGPHYLDHTYRPAAGILGQGPRQHQAQANATWVTSAPPHGLINTLDNLSLNAPSNQWYFDSGASSHMTASPGFADPSTETSLQ